MDKRPDVATLIKGLVSDQESERKFAVFKLQNLLGEPAFADAFVQGDGLLPLRQAVVEASGNTLAYAFGSLNAMLELDVGWDAVDGVVIEKAVSLAVSHPLINIVRNALTLLVLIVSRPMRNSKRASAAVFGFRAIKPALDNHPNFLESLVQRLSASDHTLCANALQLVNALMRDAVVNGGEHEWPKFIKRLQDLGVIGGVGVLMRGDAVQDLTTPLAQAVLEFQALTKVLLRRWKEVRVSVELAEHKRALKTIHLLSKPEPYHAETNGDGKGRKHHPEKWRRLGFESESPAWEFDETGYLGMMDFVDFARRNEDAYQKILMEQSVQPKESRCPLARASMGITLILFEHFEIEDSSAGEAVDYRASIHKHHDPEDGVEMLYRPLLLQWGRLHTAAFNAFMRIWKAAGAVVDDFFKIEELICIFVDRILSAAERKTDISKIEEEMRNTSLETARKWQMEGLDAVYEDAWGPHLVQVREQLHHESLQFMKEQRIRCMLAGAWFPVPTSLGKITWQFVRLSHNRRWLHYQIFAAKTELDPALDALHEKIDVNTITSVDSNVSANDPNVVPAGPHNSIPVRPSTDLAHAGETPARSAALQQAFPVAAPQIPVSTTTKVTILGTAPGAESESTLLELYPQSSHVASEWLDGLLLLLNQQPITKDTTRLIDMVEDWGVRLRMLNLRWDDVDWERMEKREGTEGRAVPPREGLEGGYWYAMPET